MSDQSSVFVNGTEQTGYGVETLHESEVMAAAIFNSVMDAILTINEEQQIIAFNPAAEQMFKCTANDVVGKAFDRFLPEFVRGDYKGYIRAFGQSETTKRTMKSSVLALTCLRFNGEAFPCEISISQIEVKGQKFYTAVLRDVTERKLVQEALRESEERFHSLYENSSMGLYRTDPYGQILLANPALVQMLGYSSFEELRNRDLSKDGFEPSYPRSKFIERIEQTGKISGWETVWTRRDGSKIFVRESAKIINDANGKTLYYDGTVEDITERKQAEEELNLLKHSIDVHYDGAYWMDSNNKFMYVNDAGCKALGYTREELIGKPVEQVNPKATSTAMEIIWDRLRKDGFVTLESTNRRKDGSEFPVEIVSTLVRFDDNEYNCGFARDTTERKYTEKTLWENESKYRYLIETMQDGVYRSSHEGKFLEVNPAMVRILGYDNKEELMAIDIKTQLYFVPGDRESAALDEKFEEMAIFRLRRKDGSAVWVEDHGRHVLDDKGNVLYHEGVLRDVTERMRTEEALRQSEEKFRNLFHNSEVGMFRTRVDGSEILEFNEKYLKILDYTYDEVIGNPSLNLWADKQERDEMVKMLNTEGRVTDFECRMLNKHGEVRRCLTSLRLYRETGILEGSIQDITERKRAEETLQRERNLLRTLIDNLPDRIYVKDHEDKFLLSNRAHIEALGAKNLDEVVGKKDIDFRPEELANQYSADDMRVIESGKPLLDREEPTILQNHEQGWLLTSKIPLRDLHGRVTGLVGISRDVTERKRAEKELSTLAHALRSISECVSITSMDNTLLFVNEAFLKTYGYAEHELIGKNITIVDSSSNSRELLSEIPAITQHGGWRGELINRRKDGSEFPVFLSTSMVRDDHGQPVAMIGVATDITEVKVAEEKRKSLESQLQQAQKLEGLGTLASGIAHDFNNILAIIIGHASLLEHSPADHTIIKKNTEAITKAGMRGASLVKQLLTFARKTDIVVESILLNTIVIEVSKLLFETFPKTITIALNLEKQLPEITADSNQIHQVILNLCVNARDAMPEGGLLSITTYSIQGELVRAKFPKADANEYAGLRVSDTGTGMDDVTRRRIFEPFFTTKGVGKGTGLGLSVVFGIVESHNGFIDVQSEPGKGTTFQIYFPVPLQFIRVEEVKAQSSGAISGGSETILLVEDEELLGGLVKGLLESKGYTVLLANDGNEGVEQYQQHQNEIRLVLSDFGLPKLNGFEVYKRMKNINPTVKFILASGFIEAETRSDMLEAGINIILQKPYGTEQMLQLVRSILDVK